MHRVEHLLLAALLALPGPALAQGEQFDFMPAGGRTLLLQLLGPENGAALAEIAGRVQSADEWRAWAVAQDKGLDEAALSTFAGYARLNLPIEEGALRRLAESGDAGLLPPDGMDLSIAQCQFCHSLFSGYLMHDRDEVGWKGTFKSPFHLEIPMSEVERDTFANYSAINMPLRFDEVPPELRF